ncbi:MAG: restriction endonuclease [Defluviitaleaceae bacterium]|nr:restriction endonuclease [Defluviitaleaceae bacterium]
MFKRKKTILPSKKTVMDGLELQYLSQQLRRMDDMNGAEFEALLEKLFTYLGYSVIPKSRLQPGLGDRGVDLIITKDDVSTAIQAKAWRLEYSELVDEDRIRSFIGAISLMDKPKLQGCVITTSFFTPNAKMAAASAQPKIELIDRSKLFSLFALLDVDIIADVAYHKMSEHMGYCPQCNHVLTKKFNKSTRTPYLGCPRSPDCAHTEPIQDKEIKR